MGRYINPFTDWGFKRLFGQEFSKDLLIIFLNDLFEGEFQIKDVTFKDKEQLGDTNDLRGCIFDIYCVTDDDKHLFWKMDLCFEVYGSIGKIAFYGTEKDIRSSC